MMSPQTKILVPLITPYTDDTSALSEVRFARLVKWHIDQGASGFVAGSEAAEYGCLSLGERKQLVEWLIREGRGLPIYVNISANSTASAVDLCQHAGRHGARGAIVVPPSHCALVEQEIHSFLHTIRRHGNLATTFFDPSGAWTSVGDEASVPGASHGSSFHEKELGEFAVYQTGTTTEFWTADGVCTPLALFGANRARSCWERWGQLRQIAQGIFQIYGAARVGKAALMQLDLDSGTPRGPVAMLDTTGLQLLSKLLG